MCPVLAGGSSTWTLSVGADEWTQFHESCRALALHHGIACVDGTTWHAYSAPYRTSNGSHARLSNESKQMWRWLLLATATYAAEQPRIRDFPVATPVDPYPPVQLVLPPGTETDWTVRTTAPAEARILLPRPMAPDTRPCDACIPAQEFALLWSPLPQSCPVLSQLLHCRSFGLSQAASTNPPQVSRYCFDVYRSNI